VTLWFLHESRFADRVRGLVFDSPMLDVGSSMVWVGKTASVVPAVVVRLGMVLTARRLRFRWPDYDARPIFRELNVPVAMMHGERDGQTPMAVSEAMATLRPDLVTLERVPGAGHCQTWNMDPAQYAGVFDSLLERVLDRSVPTDERERSAVGIPGGG
ncbi:MAG: alpha/beta hydrolase, partial [Dehalococcoidia bacterium]|nr:alpha/beta hydrolase [Dehalococcoidia bacterium]